MGLRNPFGETSSSRSEHEYRHIIILYFSIGFSVFVSIFLMATTDTEHPPASGTAMGVVIAGFAPLFQLTVFIMASSALLLGVQRLLKERLKDLV